MAQGAVKKSKASTTGRRPNILGPKKGARTIAPRKATLVKQQKITKKHSAGLIAKTERTLAGKVGHLELLEGGKRSSKDVGKKKAGEKVKGGEKGKGR